MNGRLSRVLMTVVILVLPAWILSVRAATLVLQIRDVQTGAPVPAEIRLYPVATAIGVTRDRVEAVVSVAPVEYVHAIDGHVSVYLKQPVLARVDAPGYITLDTVLEPGAAGWTLWLKPDSQLVVDDVIAESMDTLRLHGVVYDAATLEPVIGAELRLDPPGLLSWSDVGGEYQFEIYLLGEVDEAAQFLRLEVQAPGRPVLVDTSIPAVAGDIWRNVDLGNTGASALHRHRYPPHEAVQRIDDVLRGAPMDGDVEQPPLSVRVGFADASCTQTCCTANCTHVCVFDLETYVRRGITYEWIGSWTQHALRAGTVAYRSYGAWHALNPVPGRPFDLCSSACCQVNGPNVISAGIQAARATAGLMLKRNDAVFRSEYSAENNCLLGSLSCSNNNLSCGNGFNGAPAFNWPCLEDVVGLNRDCFGHGRGMSQWGTQRWSRSPYFRLWPRIVDHYYNGEGSGSGMRSAVMTHVLDILDAAVSPASVAPGQSFEMLLNLLNRAAESHQAVLIGASIRRDSDPFISDPGNDRLVELVPGSGLVTRDFVVPLGASLGSYTLWVSLYLDVDGDGIISGNDLVQALVQYPDALQVAAAGDHVFADDFEL